MFFLLTHTHTHMHERPHNFYFSNWMPRSTENNVLIFLWRQSPPMTLNIKLLFLGSGHLTMPIFMIIFVAWLEFFLVKSYDQTQTPKFWGRRKNENKNKKTLYIWLALRYENIDIVWKCNKNWPHTCSPINLILMNFVSEINTNSNITTINTEEERGVGERTLLSSWQKEWQTQEYQFEQTLQSTQ